MRTPRIALPVSALSLALATSPLLAQQTYGSPTAGTGGLAPLLTSIRPGLNDPGFRLDVQCAAPSSLAAVVLGTASGSLPLVGAELLVDPSSLVGSFQGLTAPPGPGEGSVSFGLPIPNLPPLVGFPLFFQALVLDPVAPQGLAASRGWRLAVGDAPQVFVACSVSGSDPYHLVDPAGGTVTESGAVAETDNVTAAVYDEAGGRIFTGSSIRSLVGVADTSTSPLSWSTLYQSPGAGCYGLALDVERQLLWTLTQGTSGGRELVALDVDAASMTYGLPVHETTNVAVGIYERWAMSKSGDRIALLTLLPSTLTVVDTDPSSPTFLQNLVSGLPVPVNTGSPIDIATQAAFTTDERYLFVTIQLAGATPAEVARFDLFANAWVDHNAALPGQQNLGVLSNPAVTFGSAPTSITVSNAGDFAIVGGFGNCGWVGRLDLDPKDPSAFAWTPFMPAAPLENGWTAGLSKDETEVAVATWPDSRCGQLAAPQLVRVDATSGAMLGTVPIPANGNGGNQNWYTVVYR